MALFPMFCGSREGNGFLMLPRRHFGVRLALSWIEGRLAGAFAVGSASPNRSIGRRLILGKTSLQCHERLCDCGSGAARLLGEFRLAPQKREQAPALQILDCQTGIVGAPTFLVSLRRLILAGVVRVFHPLCLQIIAILRGVW